MDARRQPSHRLHISTSDPRRTCQIVEDVLDARVAITALRGATRIAVSHVKTTELSVVELVTSGHVDCDIVCGERFIVETVLGGTLQVEGYLRRVRLDRAHGDLLAGHAAAVTVADVAQGCGFGHAGRFPAAYQRKNLETPAATLRRAGTHEHLFT